MIRITDAIAIEEREVEESFVRAAGPGGQNVNKVATAVQLRFDIRRSPSLPHDVRARLEKLAGRRLTQEGVLIITAQRYRTQERNRQDALERLVALLRRAAVRPAPADPPSRPPAPGGVASRPRAAALASRSCGRRPPASSRTRWASSPTRRAARPSIPAPPPGCAQTFQCQLQNVRSAIALRTPSRWLQQGGP